MTHGHFKMLASVSEMRPMANGDRFAAKATRVVRHTARGAEDVPVFFGECWGPTREAALAELNAQFSQWADAQPNST
ncbi:MAG: hypothetical protein K2R93_12515 [Gemmatimonadaceae bacterium]|nr:hypothetical protein [Gemmatimonadaceae bacterium]